MLSDALRRIAVASQSIGIGAVLVHFTNTLISSQFTEAWPILLGGLFIFVTLFLPEGIVGWLKKHWGSLAALTRRKPTTAT